MSSADPVTAALHKARRQLDIAERAATAQRERTARIAGLVSEVHTAVSEDFDASDEATRRYQDLLGDISLHVNWRYATRQLTTEQKDLWADAVEAWSARLNEGTEETATVDRWWRDG